MNVSLILACIWALSANVIAMFPSKHKHWPSAYVLMTFGIPLLGFVYWENGFWIGTVVFIAAASILRWPVRFFLRWIANVTKRPAES
ncbi:MAG: DUF2484 family protein [Boseongicola sp.]|nr:MAG: DUF2484 family protein [Boseongicola sp.]